MPRAGSTLLTKPPIRASANPAAPAARRASRSVRDMTMISSAAIGVWIAASLPAHPHPVSDLEVLQVATGVASLRSFRARCNAQNTGVRLDCHGHIRAGIRSQRESVSCNTLDGADASRHTVAGSVLRLRLRKQRDPNVARAAARTRTTAWPIENDMLFFIRPPLMYMVRIDASTMIYKVLPNTKKDYKGEVAKFSVLQADSTGSAGFIVLTEFVRACIPRAVEPQIVR